MKRLKTILVGVDFSEASKAALIEADYIAPWEGSELHVVHVISMEEAESQMETAEPSEEIFESIRNHLKSFTEEVTNLSGKKFYHVCVGNPYTQLTTMVDATDSNLMVIGSHGHGAHPHRVGAIASKCVRGSKVPVMIVRKQHRIGYKEIVMCVDFSKASEEAVKYAAEIACNENARLHILHVWCDPWGIYAFPIEGLNHYLVADQIKEGKSRAERRLEALRTEIMQELIAANISTSLVEAPTVIEGITKFINESEGIDLVVVGTHGHSKVSEFFIGTTTERLIHRSSCSVLTVCAPEVK